MENQTQPILLIHSQHLQIIPQTRSATRTHFAAPKRAPPTNKYNVTLPLLESDHLQKEGITGKQDTSKK